MRLGKDYLGELAKRSRKSRVSRKFQLDGLEVARILQDEEHKTLYIKIAKELGGNVIREIAGQVAENKNIKNKGGYFMAILKKRRQKRNGRIDFKN